MSTKMKIIGMVIVLVIIGYIVSVFFIAVKHDNHDDNLKESIIKIEHERDSFQLLFKQSVSREQQHILRHEADSIKAINLEKSIAFRESKIKSYQQRLYEVNKIIVQHPDSFLIKRYP